MTDPAALLALAAVVEGGIGPDREIDRLVRAALFGVSTDQAKHLPMTYVPHYTSSLDAAYPLLREKLPDRVFRVHEFLDRSIFDVRLAGVDKDGWPLGSHRGRASTLDRAIVAAVLRGVAATITPQEK